MDKPLYIDWIVEEADVSIKDGQPIYCYRIDYNNNDEILDNWALHIRRHYRDDSELLDDAAINIMTVEQYLHDYVIPQRTETLGPTARAGDITEIIVADLLEFVHGYSVPRCKQKNRAGKNTLEQGTDIIAYRFFKEDKSPSNKDELVAAEVKASLTGSDYIPLQSAIIDSKKDDHRLARTIDYYRKKLKNLGYEVESKEISRFLTKPDNDYKIKFLAAGFSSKETVDTEIQIDLAGKEVSIIKGQEIFFIHGRKLMELTHNIFERCTK